MDYPISSERMAYILTTSGRRLSLVSPDTASVCAEDIAHGLSQICRWSGQTRDFYTVAEHSLWVSKIVDPAHQLRALLHDATEAYLQDVPSPVKDLVPGYREIERRVWITIAEHFGLPPHDPEADAEIHRADMQMRATELRDQFNVGDSSVVVPYNPVTAISVRRPMARDMARELFLDRLAQLRATSHYFDFSPLPTPQPLAANH